MLREFKSNTVKTRALDVFYLHEGEPGNHLVLCVHGFPDIARTWRHFMPLLAHTGFYVVAPNLRGYAPTSIPTDQCYQTAALAYDVLELIDKLGYKEAMLVGHDWGADAVLGAAQIAPDVVKKVVALAEYYGKVATEFAQKDPEEQQRSYYMHEFLQPLAFERFRKDNLAYLQKLWKTWSPQWHCPTEEMDQILETFRTPTVVEAALSYDRAALSDDPQYHRDWLEPAQTVMDNDPVPVQTLLLYGEKDGCHGKNVIEKMPDELFPYGTKKMIPGVGHFLHLEQPEVVNNLILKFLTNH